MVGVFISQVSHLGAKANNLLKSWKVGMSTIYAVLINFPGNEAATYRKSLPWTAAHRAMSRERIYDFP